MDNPWHNSSFEGSGFVRLFLPMNRENQDYFTRYAKPAIHLGVTESFSLFSPTNCNLFFDILLAVIGFHSALICGILYQIVSFGMISGLLLLHIVQRVASRLTGKVFCLHFLQDS